MIPGFGRTGFGRYNLPRSLYHILPPWTILWSLRWSWQEESPRWVASTQWCHQSAWDCARCKPEALPQQSHYSSRSLWRESAGEDFGTAPWGHSPCCHIGASNWPCRVSSRLVYYHILPYITIYYHVLPYITIYYHILPHITTYYHILPHITIISLPYIIQSLMDGFPHWNSIVTQIYWWTNGRSRISWRINTPFRTIKTWPYNSPSFRGLNQPQKV